MALANTQTHYGSVSKLFHWLTALAVISLLIVGWWMGGLDKTLAYKWTVYNVHKLVGLTVLAVTLLRILWLLHCKHPALPHSIPAIERFAARAVHVALYTVLMLMPLSGWVMSTAGDHAPTLGKHALPMPTIALNKTVAHQWNTLHEVLAWVIVALVVLHILGALKHHFIDKNNVLRRMLPGKH